MKRKLRSWTAYLAPQKGPFSVPVFALRAVGRLRSGREVAKTLTVGVYRVHRTPAGGDAGVTWIGQEVLNRAGALARPGRRVFMVDVGGPTPVHRRVKEGIAAAADGDVLLFQARSDEASALVVKSLNIRGTAPEAIA